LEKEKRLKARKRPEFIAPAPPPIVSPVERLAVPVADAPLPDSDDESDDFIVDDGISAAGGGVVKWPSKQDSKAAQKSALDKLVDQLSKRYKVGEPDWEGEPDFDDGDTESAVEAQAKKDIADITARIEAGETVQPTRQSTRGGDTRPDYAENVVRVEQPSGETFPGDWSNVEEYAEKIIEENKAPSFDTVHAASKPADSVPPSEFDSVAFPHYEDPTENMPILDIEIPPEISSVSRPVSVAGSPVVTPTPSPPPPPAPLEIQSSDYPPPDNSAIGLIMFGLLALATATRL
jgi:hypothetical protein